MTIHIVMVNAADIKLEDLRFKVSRNAVTGRFRDSVRELGILDPPLFMKEAGGYTVVSGMNRVLAAVDSGYTEISARVIDRFDPELFARECVLKSLRGELGPVGKLRAVSIVTVNAGERRELTGLLRRWLGVPDDAALGTSVESFPGDLRNYLDSRDAPFRTMKELASLGAASLDRVARWTGLTAMGLNHIRQLAEMLREIEVRDGSLSGIDDSALEENEDRRERTGALMEAVYRCRYPRYSALRDEVGRIAREFRKMGIELDFPRYFDGNGFRLSVAVGRDDDPGSQAARFGSLSPDLIRELQKML